MANEWQLRQGDHEVAHTRGPRMRIRLGIGGKLGPFRAGVSTRGVGIGVGPLSVGAGRGRRRGSSSNGSGCALILVLLVVLLFAGWPWMLGTFIATKAGVEPGSAGWEAAGWVPE